MLTVKLVRKRAYERTLASSMDHSLYVKSKDIVIYELKVQVPNPIDLKLKKKLSNLCCQIILVPYLIFSDKKSIMHLKRLQDIFN
jgi:glucose-6-phosphate-specific signal transduction histidine kinase